VLFHDDRPVFSTPAHSVTKPRQTSDVVAHDSPPVQRRGDRLAPLADPFRADTSISVARTTSSANDSVGLSMSGGLPGARLDVVSPIAPPARLGGYDVQPSAVAHLLLRSPRGPPRP
jgi:hypothetical protein